TVNGPGSSNGFCSGRGRWADRANYEQNPFESPGCSYTKLWDAPGARARAALEQNPCESLGCSCPDRSDAPGALAPVTLESRLRRWRRGRVAEGGGLLNRYTGVNLYRGFESLRLRQFPDSRRDARERGLRAATRQCVVAAPVALSSAFRA